MRLFFLVAVSLLPLFGQRVVIDAGTVIDGRGGVSHNKQITVEGSRIVSIGDGQSAANSGPATIDLRKMTVMPGWIDTHVHLDWHFGKDGRSYENRWTSRKSWCCTTPRMHG